MSAPLLHSINDQHFWLSAERCIYWEEAQTLILSDTHFGKTGHFRKNGIAVPQQVYKEDLQRFVQQVTHFKPQQIIVVGDLFHSRENRELELFLKWRRDIAHTRLVLVRGNHDLLDAAWYAAADIEVQEGIYQVDAFDFVHDPADNTETRESRYCFSGHIHPGVSLNGSAKQSLQFPCFFFGAGACILPAFSRFSGLKIMRSQKTDSVYAIANGAVMKL
ncbi:MAG TPA: ligase-associated DNA damage response endonuclease PdeM [Sediminibacterium sp.]|nr:ligase-associated DNA damage response endonuclease PdeM [Sediminibacterium sp.]